MSGLEWRRSRGLGTARAVGQGLLEEYRKLKMTGEVPCKFPWCFNRSGKHLTEVWQVNWLIPHKLLRRMVCDHCGLEFVLFSALGKYDDLSLIQVILKTDEAKDMWDLGFPKGTVNVFTFVRF